MQNKYKLPDDVRKTMLSIVRGYNRRQAEIKRREEEICSVSGERYETYTIDGEEHRVFTPSGKGGTSSPVENQAAALAWYHESDSDYLRNKAIDEALNDLPVKHFTPSESRRIKENIIESCRKGRFYNFNYSGITEIERSRFYQYRNMFLYFLAKKLNFL